MKARQTNAALRHQGDHACPIPTPTTEDFERGQELMGGLLLKPAQFAHFEADVRRAARGSLMWREFRLILPLETANLRGNGAMGRRELAVIRKAISRVEEEARTAFAEGFLAGYDRARPRHCAAHHASTDSALNGCRIVD